MSKTLILQPIEALFSDKLKISKTTGIDPYCVLRSGKNQSVSDTCYNSGDHPSWEETLAVDIDHESKCFLEIKDKEMVFPDNEIGSVELDLKEVEAVEIMSQWLPIVQDKKIVGYIFLKTWIENVTEQPETNERLGMDTVEYEKEELVKQNSLSDVSTTVGTLDSITHLSAEKDYSNKDMTRSGELAHEETNEPEVKNFSEFLESKETDSTRKKDLDIEDSRELGIFYLTEVDLDKVLKDHEQDKIGCESQIVLETPVEIKQQDGIIDDKLESLKIASPLYYFLEDDYKKSRAKKEAANTPLLNHMDESDREMAFDEAISSYTSDSGDNAENDSLKYENLERFLFDERENEVDLEDEEMEEKHSCSEEACDNIKTAYEQTGSDMYEIDASYADDAGCLSENKKDVGEEVPSGLWGIYDLDIFNYTLRGVPGYDFEKYLSFKINGEEMVFKEEYNYKVF